MELDGVRMIASLTFDGYGPAILPATAIPRHLRDRFVRSPSKGSHAGASASPFAAKGSPRRRRGR